MDKLYSNCPLKKRPVYAIKEESEEEIDDCEPVDLSAKRTPVLSVRAPVYFEHNRSLQKIVSGHYKISPIEEEIYIRTEAVHQSSFRNCYTDSEESLCPPYSYSPGPSASSDYMSPSAHRDTSISPTGTAIGKYTDFPPKLFKKNVVNYNNNVIRNDEVFLPIDQQNKYLPTTSSTTSVLSSLIVKNQVPYNLPYNGNRTNAPRDFYQEPENLSIKCERKVLVISNDSIANIQHHPQQRSTIPRGGLYYQCQQCSKCYSTSAGLAKHQQCHIISLSEPQDFSIQKHNSPSRKTKIKYQEIAQHTEASHSASPQSPKVITKSTPQLHRYQCQDCGKSYSTYSGLTKHQQFHCPAVEGNQAKKFFNCKNCDKVYVSLGALKMHIRTHTLPCKCPLCGKAFSRPWLLQGHIRTHTGEKPFSCQHCHRAFADRSNLRAHLQTHSDVKKYSCTSCTKTFSRMSLLGKHVQGGCPGHGHHHHQSAQSPPIISSTLSDDHDRRATDVNERKGVEAGDFVDQHVNIGSSRHQRCELSYSTDNVKHERHHHHHHQKPLSNVGYNNLDNMAGDEYYKQDLHYRHHHQPQHHHVY